MKTLVTAFIISFTVTAFAKDGRFQIVRINEFPNSSMMIDSHTGKIWKQSCYTELKDGNCAVSAWAPMNVVGVNVSEKEVWKMAGDYERQKSDGSLTKVSEAISDRMPASVGGENKEQYQTVKGYIRSDGTYVAPYIRTSPNGTTYDNIRPRK